MTSEAEYAALASAGQELMFITNVIDEIDLAERPGIIFGDNESALALVKNRQVSARTKHIDIRHHFLRDMWERGDLGVAHVPGDENEADICTKNIITQLHKKHRDRIRDGKLWLNQWFHVSTTRREDVVDEGETNTVRVVETVDEQTEVGRSTVEIVETVEELDECQDID